MLILIVRNPYSTSLEIISNKSSKFINLKLMDVKTFILGSILPILFQKHKQNLYGFLSVISTSTASTLQVLRVKPIGYFRLN